MASTSGDKTVNKVALCSAIFAGFAYVGYSVVRTAFCRKLGKRRDSEGTFCQISHIQILTRVLISAYHHDDPLGPRMYFRRLSQTTQTDCLLGNLDMGHSGRVILRPMSVQDRIRDLNMRARQFTDTMLAIQGGAGVALSPRHSPSPLPGPRSLQVCI